jgi:type VI secretion system secreted protein VgrG
MESEGLFGYFEQASDGKSHTLIVTDSLDTFQPLSPQTVEFYRAGTNNETCPGSVVGHKNAAKHDAHHSHL